MITWTCRVQASSEYRFVEALVGQVVAMETEISFVILKNLLEVEPTGRTVPEAVDSRAQAI
jgi:hypothetical protein